MEGLRVQDLGSWGSGVYRPQEKTQVARFFLRLLGKVRNDRRLEHLL